MKKFTLSAIVIGAFIIYSFYQRIAGMQTMPVSTSKTGNSAGFSQSLPTDTPTPTPSQSSSSDNALPTDTPTPQPVASSGLKDGTYTGDSVDAFYGMIQVQATIANGKISNVQFLQYPNDRGTSIMINRQADPMLAQEAIQSQSANVDIVSGATESSQAFVQSLQSALDKAK